MSFWSSFYGGFESAYTRNSRVELGTRPVPYSIEPLSHVPQKVCPIHIIKLTLANSPSHFSIPDLYTYGFKGEPWRDDRRELEAALWEIDQLERQTEYKYHRPSPNHPWTSGMSSAWHPSYGPANARYHDVQMARSNSDLQPISESEMTSLSSQGYGRYDDEYQRGYAHSTYPSAGYPGGQFPPTERIYHYAPPLRHSNTNDQDFLDSVGMSNHQNYGFVPPMASSRTSSYDSNHRSQYSSQASQTPAQRISTPEQLQMVTRRNSQNESPSPVHTADSRHAMSSHWSAIATEGTVTSESSSVMSPRGMYNQNFRDMGPTSGYTFDGRSYDEFYGSSSDDEEYISDGIASDDTGYYCSSDSDCWENDNGSCFYDDRSD